MVSIFFGGSYIMKPLKIRLRVPYHTKVTRYTQECLKEFDTYAGPIEFDIRSDCGIPGAWQGSSQANHRNNMVNDGRSCKMFQTDFDFDWLYTADADNEVSIKKILRLLEHDKEIISGAYLMRNSEDLYGAYYWRGPIGNAFAYPKEMTGCKRVDAIGAGGLLIKKSAFMKMEYPWFRHYLITDRKRQEQKETGCDIGFSINAGKSGIPIYCDFDTILEHKPGSD